MDVRVGLCRGSAAAQERYLIDSDEAMARRIAAGDADAWDMFFDRFSPWAYRFACRHLDGNRADAEDLYSDILMTAAKSMSSFDPAGGAHTKDAVNRALACLPERQASLLIGKYVEGYTTDELARWADMTPKAVESALARARGAFRSVFTRLMGSTEGVGTSG